MKNQAVYVFAKWQIEKGHTVQVQEILTELKCKTREEPGNLVYSVHQSISDENLIVLYEGYRDAAAMEAHRNSPHYRELVAGKIVPLLESREVVILTKLD